MNDWPFTDPPNVAVFTSRQIINGCDWIYYVTHDKDDGAWQFHMAGQSFDWQYKFDAFGRRIEKGYDPNDGSGYHAEEQYLFFGDNVLVDYDGTGVWKSQYNIPTLDGNLSVRKNGDTSPHLCIFPMQWARRAAWLIRPEPSV